MASPTGAKMGSLVAPAAPEEAQPAVDADPGAVEAAKAEAMQFTSEAPGSTRAGDVTGEAPDAAEAGEDEPETWIEIELKDEDGGAIAGELYRVEAPGGVVRTGTLDDRGMARVTGVRKGTCKVTFPRLDETAWRKK